MFKTLNIQKKTIKIKDIKRFHIEFLTYVTVDRDPISAYSYIFSEKFHTVLTNPQGVRLQPLCRNKKNYPTLDKD